MIPVQSGLASIKERVYQEICERYGFCEECTRAEPSSMKELIRMINERLATTHHYIVIEGLITHIAVIEPPHRETTLKLKMTRASRQNIGESCFPLGWSIENPLVLSLWSQLRITVFIYPETVSESVK